VPDGVLNVLKPPGITSHDLVDEVRRITRTRKVGHAGTLDPAAAGVMILMLGAATRLSEFLTAARKVYRAEITLGITTDSLDGEGVIVPGPSRSRADDVTAEQLRETLQGLTGELEMAPPMYSAVRHQGRRLYELAREGKRAQVEPRPVRVDRFELLDFQPGSSQQPLPAEGSPLASQPEGKQASGTAAASAPRAVVEIECSKGTYVRSLAAEVGERLGCGAHLSFLVRTAVGEHTLAEASTLEELQAAVAADRLRELLTPPADALREMPKVTVTSEGAEALRHGVRWPAAPEIADVDMAAVLSPEGCLLCVAEVVRSDAGAELQPRRVFMGSSLPAEGGDAL